MKPIKNPLTDGVISVSVRDRISADGKTIRQKRFVRASKNPTKSATTPTPPKPTDPPAAEPSAAPAPPAPAPAPPTTTTPAADTAPAPAPPTFTPGQDAQLLDLKSKNTSWKQISIMMDGKPQWALKDRFKELMAKTTGTVTADEGGEKTAEEKKKKEEEAERKKVAAEEKRKAGEERKKAWEEKKRMEKEEAEKASAGAAGEAKAAEPKAEEKKKKILFVDGGRFTLDEIVLIHKLAERYENRKWLEVASKFFDTTGKRVHPDEMRDALSGGGN